MEKPSPPLFIKVEKYDELIKNLQQLRAYALSIRDALDTLIDIHRSLQMGINITQRALDKLNTVLASLDESLYQTGEKPKTEKPKEIEEYIRNLQNEMEKIKKELKDISNIRRS